MLGARQTAKDAVNSAVETRHGSADIFLASQKQIYNLMKMDSFQRFLQSNLFKVGEIKRCGFPQIT